jgi:hypothetical protein
MPPSSPFIAPDGTVDTDRVLAEAVPLAGLIGLFVALAVPPFAVVYLFAGGSLLGLLLTVVGQFVLAVGTGVVLMHVVARALHLAEER